MTIRVNKRAIRDFERASKKVPKELEQARKDLGESAEKRARRKHRWRTRTGKLLSAIETDTKKDKFSVSINDRLAPYGKYIHRGTKYISPDPFVANAVKYVMDKDAEKVIRKAVLKPYKKKGF